MKYIIRFIQNLVTTKFMLLKAKNSNTGDSFEVCSCGRNRLCIHHKVCS